MPIVTRGNPVVGIIVGLVFMWIPMQFLILPAVQVASNGERTTGTIVSVSTSRSSKGAVTYTPTIEFHTKTGEKISFTPSYSSSTLPHQTGQGVYILYDKDNPHKAIVDDFLGTWLIPGVFFLIGLLVFILCVIATIKGRGRGNLSPPGQPQSPLQPPGQAQLPPQPSIPTQLPPQPRGPTPPPVI